MESTQCGEVIFSLIGGILFLRDPLPGLCGWLALLLCSGIIFTTFTGDIAAGICLGILADVFIKVYTGKAKEVHWVMYLLCIPLVLYFIA